MRISELLYGQLCLKAVHKQISNMHNKNMGTRYYWVSYILQGTKFTLNSQIPLLHIDHCKLLNNKGSFWRNFLYKPDSTQLVPSTNYGTSFVWAIKHQHTGHRCAYQLVHKWIRIVMELSWMWYVLCVVVYLVHLFHTHPMSLVLLHAWIKTSGLMPEFLWN